MSGTTSRAASSKPAVPHSTCGASTRTFRSSSASALSSCSGRAGVPGGSRQRHELRPPIWTLCLLFAVSALGVLWWEPQREYPIANANPLIVGLAISVILVVSRIRLGDRMEKFVTRLASASFGAFLVHVFFLELFFEHLYDVEAGPLLLVVQYLGLLALMAAVSYALSLT
ncbi:acyltransferase family protein [Brevibacterium oceani]|uniref:acyltransferase family protein n=1 Tax=Brevibacterium oceani TaxID=358099 RepID=UPI00215A00B6|nr:acyltransferase family protein [Brevibacterium oceani]